MKKKDVYKIGVMMGEVNDKMYRVIANTGCDHDGTCIVNYDNLMSIKRALSNLELLIEGILEEEDE